MNTRRKIIAGLLSFTMIFTAVSVSAAESVAEPVSDSTESYIEEPAGGEESSSEENAGTENTSDVTVKRIHFAKDYQEVYEALKTVNSWKNYDIIEYEDYDYESDDMIALDDGAPMAAASESAVGTSRDESGTQDYSETNVRTEGVDEADIIKTDGKYIYILRDGSDLIIVSADGGTMTELSSTAVAGDASWGLGAKELFINGSKIHIIRQYYREDGEYYYYYYYNDSPDMMTEIATYDISDPKAPVLEGRFTQSGSYSQARMSGGILYLFTNWQPDMNWNSFEESNVIPFAGGDEIPAGNICIPDIVTNNEMLVVSSVDPAEPARAMDSKALVSGASQLYVGTSGIYASNEDYWSEKTKTEIVKFTYENGRIEGRAAGTVRGTLNDTFSIDEYNGCLRVLTTYTGSDRGVFYEFLSDLFDLDYYDGSYWTRHNALYILDENMNRIGKLSGLAEDEEIKSARFFGDTVYFVTFRNTDPLFSADLSDPRSPKILGELKIPGFSSYLHPMGDNLLVGLGYDADEKYGSVTGVKLSLFDLTDPADVQETGKTLIDRMTYCPAIENYKCVFADAGRKLVGFYNENHYFLYHLTDEKDFERVLLYDFYADDLQGDSEYNEIRGLYIGSTFYVAGGGFVTAFDMENGFRELSCLVFE